MCHTLIIEDEFLIAEYIADLAERAGATSYTIVDSEAQAFQSVSDRKPGMILSDVDLKRGGHGPAAVAAIRKEAGNIPVIFITGTPQACNSCDYAMAILEKPIQPERVMAAMSRIISSL
jgi:DNA-binding NtrC family response regulator